MPRDSTRATQYIRAVEAKRGGGGAPTVPREAEFTDSGNADRFAAQHAQDFRYCAEWDQWFHFDGARWRPDHLGERWRCAGQVARDIFNENPHGVDAEALYKFAASSCEARRLRAMLELARWNRSKTCIPVLANQFDADPWLFNCLNGTVNLLTGEVREPRREDLQLKCAPVIHDPQALARAWLEFLEEITHGDEELMAFLRRAVGYSLSGSTEERALFILYGTGANGKSTFIETIQALLGDYATVAPVEALLMRKVQGESSERVFAPLKGARFLSVTETEENDRLSMARIKRLTGGDTVAGRFLYGEQFKFQPSFKLWLATNHQPNIGEVNPAAQDRLKLIPFTVRIEPDKQRRDLKELLKAELPGILNWALQGAREWRANGLGECPAVDAATAKMLAAEDLIARFLEERCSLGPLLEVGKTALYAAYRDWAREANEWVCQSKIFSRRLMERGFRERNDGKKRLWCGIALGQVGNPPSAEKAHEAQQRILEENDGDVPF